MTARDCAGMPAYTIQTWGVGGLEFRTESNLKLVADYPLEGAASCDMLVIPGGRGARSRDVVDRLAPWLQKNAPCFGRIVSICTGAYPLAHSGLADGRTVTTHWAHGAQLQSCSPAEQEGFRSSIWSYRIHTFQACDFDHSATAPRAFLLALPLR